MVLLVAIPGDIADRGMVVNFKPPPRTNLWQGDHKIEPPPKKVNTKLGDELEEIDEDRR